MAQNSKQSQCAVVD